MEDLRTRIGKVLHAKYGSSSIMGDDPNWDDVHPATQKKWRKDAEALIRELGNLRPKTCGVGVLNPRSSPSLGKARP